MTNDSDERTAGELILNNYTLFIEAKRIYDRAVQSEIFGKLRECTAEMSQDWYVSDYFGRSGQEWWLAPKSWKVDGDNKTRRADAKKREQFKAYFALCRTNDEDEDDWLSALCEGPDGEAQAGFCLIDYEDDDAFESVSGKLGDAGFTQDDDGYWRRPIVLIAGDLASAYRTGQFNYDSALLPFVSALKDLKTAEEWISPLLTTD